MSNLDTGFHPKRTHGREQISRVGTRPHHRNGSPAYMPSDEYMRGFEEGHELAGERPESVIGYIAAAAFGAIAGMGLMALILGGFFG